MAQFGRFGVKGPRRSENVFANKCYLYGRTRHVVSGRKNVYQVTLSDNRRIEAVERHTEKKTNPTTHEHACNHKKRCTTIFLRCSSIRELKTSPENRQPQLDGEN